MAFALMVITKEVVEKSSAFIVLGAVNGPLVPLLVFTCQQLQQQQQLGPMVQRTDLM